MSFPYRRIVRVAPQFYDWLDLQTTLERSATGEPSGHDFLTHPALEDIRQLFSEDFDKLPTIGDDPNYRVHLSRAFYWPKATIYGRLVEGTVWPERISIQHTPDGLPDPESGD